MTIQNDDTLRNFENFLDNALSSEVNFRPSVAEMEDFFRAFLPVPRNRIDLFHLGYDGTQNQISQLFLYQSGGLINCNNEVIESPWDTSDDSGYGAITGNKGIIGWQKSTLLSQAVEVQKILGGLHKDSTKLERRVKEIKESVRNSVERQGPRYSEVRDESGRLVSSTAAGSIYSNLRVGDYFVGANASLSEIARKRSSGLSGILRGEKDERDTEVAAPQIRSGPSVIIPPLAAWMILRDAAMGREASHDHYLSDRVGKVSRVIHNLDEVISSTFCESAHVYFGEILGVSESGIRAHYVHGTISASALEKFAKSPLRAVTQTEETHILDPELFWDSPLEVIEGELALDSLTHLEVDAGIVSDQQRFRLFPDIIDNVHSYVASRYLTMLGIANAQAEWRNVVPRPIGRIDEDLKREWPELYGQLQNEGSTEIWNNLKKLYNERFCNGPSLLHHYSLWREELKSLISDSYSAKSNPGNNVTADDRVRLSRIGALFAMVRKSNRILQEYCKIDVTQLKGE